MEFLLAQALESDPRFHVHSAGTHAERGWPVNPPMDRLLEDRGIDVSEFVARQADRQLLAGSDLVLTATQQHLAWVTEHEPRTVVPAKPSAPQMAAAAEGVSLRA